MEGPLESTVILPGSSGLGRERARPHSDVSSVSLVLGEAVFRWESLPDASRKLSDSFLGHLYYFDIFCSKANLAKIKVDQASGSIETLVPERGFRG